MFLMLKYLIIVRHKSNDCEVLFMTKYSTKLKIKIASKYLDEQNSINGLVENIRFLFRFIKYMVSNLLKLIVRNQLIL